ncbi:MAG: ribose 5-phosphate isomerase B [Nitrospirae bacterium]|nr:MAG: ribose 5-phosphate isomerase B [Nitrospirota bacterium]
MKILIGCDHAGYELKKALLPFFKEMGIEVRDVGTDKPDAVDYTDYGEIVSKEISEGRAEKGILICGTGIGMSIVANKFPGVRASLCSDVYTAKMSRLHNDANILVMPGRLIGVELAKEIVRVWFSTPFEGGRHKKRIEKIMNIERKIKEKC